MLSKKTIAVTLIASCSGCAPLSGWRPTVDMYNDQYSSRLHIDMQQCEELASESSGMAKETSVSAIVGALIGAAGGAAIGAVAGDPATGAAIGAAGAGIAGGAYSGVKADDRYRSAYKSCLSGRGHRVLN